MKLLPTLSLLSIEFLYLLENVAAFTPNHVTNIVTDVSPYVSHWDRLLLEEYQEAARELKDRQKRWSRKKLEESGTSLFDATAEPESELLGEKIVRIVKSTKKPLKETFNRGDVLILISEKLNNVDPIPRECLVVDVGKDWMTAAVGPSWPHGLWEMRKHPGMYFVRVDRAAPQGPLKAQRESLSLLSKGKSGSIAKLLAGFWNANDTKSLKALASGPPTFMENISTDMKMSENMYNSIEKALHLSKQKINFVPNKSQEDAIKYALSQRLSLIRGPPGTGKTKTAALLVSTALNLKINDGDNAGQLKPRILAVTHSNGAADVLLESLLQMNVPAIRLGRPASVSPKVQHRTIIAMVEQLPQIRELRRTVADTTIHHQSRAAAALDLKHSIQDAQRFIKMEAPVIVTTCIGAWQLMEEEDTSLHSNEPAFPLVVLDEAAQTTEPALLCALVASKAEQVILVGDTRQLPPTVTSQNADIRNGLSLSPMARLEKMGIPQSILKVQYRMPSNLLEFPSRYFYNGLVQCPENDRDENPPPAGFPWPYLKFPKSNFKEEPLCNDHNQSHFCFVQVGNGDTEVAHNFGGRSNPTEAAIVTQIIFQLLQAGDLNEYSIAVITPYSKQVQLIRNEIYLQSQTIKTPDIKIGTVDSFQGQEVDLVIFSAVRSNPLKELGFLRDARRLCVAITRAKRGLILVGDASTLKSCKHWESVLKFYEEKGCIMNMKDLQKTKGDDVTVREDINSNLMELPNRLNEDFSALNVDSMEVNEDFSSTLLNQNEPLYGLFSPDDEEV